MIRSWFTESCKADAMSDNVTLAGTIVRGPPVSSAWGQVGSGRVRGSKTHVEDSPLARVTDSGWTKWDSRRPPERRPPVKAPAIDESRTRSNRSSSMDEEDEDDEADTDADAEEDGSLPRCFSESSVSRRVCEVVARPERSNGDTRYSRRPNRVSVSYVSRRVW